MAARDSLEVKLPAEKIYIYIYIFSLGLWQGGRWGAREEKT